MLTPSLFPSTRTARLILPGLAALLLGTSTQAATTPFTSATVTKVENNVRYGERGEERSVTRKAVADDVIHSNNFLQSETDSRAEIEYPDGSLVRIGQNTVFSFDAGSRTLSLDRGSLLFHIPKGTGGGTIKTASLTAAITGTAGKVSTNIIAIVEGTVKLVPSGRSVHAGEFARANADGTITIAPFDPARVNDGSLVFFHGLMPGFRDVTPAEPEVATVPPLPDLRVLDVLQRAQNLPGSINHFSPAPSPVDRPRTRIDVPRRNNQPGSNPDRPGNY